MLKVTDLECARGDRPLFRALSFTVAAGEILHVRGRNGAGKTTLLRTLCGLSRALDGAIEWRGRRIDDDAAAYRRELCYVGHQDAIQGELTAAENLRYYAGLYNNAIDDVRIDAALAGVGLDNIGPALHDLPVKFLSQGQKRRLALARLLLMPRALWILDEPLTALDRATVDTLMGLFRTQLEAQGAIVLTSHQELPLAQTRTLELMP